MSVKLTKHEKGDVIIVSFSGRLTLGEGTHALRKYIRNLVIGGGSRKILLNMADVTQIDSSGLGELVVAYTAITNAGGEMKLLSLTKHAHDLLENTKLCTVFEAFEDEASAVGSYTDSLVGHWQVDRIPY